MHNVVHIITRCGPANEQLRIPFDLEYHSVKGQTDRIMQSPQHALTNKADLLYPVNKSIFSKYGYVYMYMYMYVTITL